MSLVINDRAIAVLEAYREKYSFFSDVASDVRSAVEAIVASYDAGGTLLACGNGGSSTDAAHIVGELMKGFTLKRPLGDDYIQSYAKVFPNADVDFLSRAQGALPAVDLSAFCGLSTAICNDIGSDLLFVQGVLGLGRRNDVFFGISTSGNSDNVLKAGMVARQRGLSTIALTGSDGGKMKKYFDICICVPASVTADIQDMHTPCYHAICAAVEHHFWEE